MATVIQHVKIFTGSQFIEKGYVKFENGRILEVGEGEYQNAKDTTTILSFPGDTITPGLIDSHIHALGGNVESIEQSFRFGITTVCDMHNDPRDNAKLIALAKDSRNFHKYADFKCAGLGAIIEGGWPIPVMIKEFDDVPNGHCIAEKIISHWPKLKHVTDVDPYVKEQVEHNNASYIKMFHELGDSIGMEDLPPPPMDIQKKVVEAAHARGLIAVGHAFSHAGAMALLEAGADGLTHIFFDEAPHDDVVRLMKQTGAHCCPTLALCASQTGQVTDIQNKFVQHPFAQKMLLAKHEGKPVGFAMDCQAKVGVEYAYKATRALYEAGVPLIVGTDAAGKEIGIPYGVGVHMEMHLMVHEVGMSVGDVLAAATATIANRFQFHDRGKLESGKLADFVLFAGDIEKTLGDSRNLCLPVKTVWRHGVQAEAFKD